MFSVAARMSKLKLKGDTQTTDQYINHAGQKRFRGNSKLKGTQCLAQNLWVNQLIHKSFELLFGPFVGVNGASNAASHFLNPNYFHR